MNFATHVVTCISVPCTSRDIDTAFATFGRERPDALFVTRGPFLLSRRMQLALLAARHAIPTSYGSREYAEMGGARFPRYSVISFTKAHNAAWRLTVPKSYPVLAFWSAATIPLRPSLASRGGSRRS